MMKVLKEFGKTILKMTLAVLGVIAYLTFLLAPAMVTEDENLLFLWLGIVIIISFYYAILHSIANEKGRTLPYFQRIKSSIQEANKKFLIGIAIFVGFIVVGIVLEDDTTKQSETTTATTPTQQFDPSKYYTPPTTKTFYTNALTNVRACASADCKVLAQTAKNTPVPLNYTSTYEMPEWVPVTWTNVGTQSPAYIHKSTLSSTYTYTPTYSSPSTIHYDDSYKYNYRTGYSGNYGYNYDVEGYSDSGDYFYGNVDTSGKYGDGYIYDDYGNEVYVETEWVDYGVMEATDEYGNTYEFEVE